MVALGSSPTRGGSKISVDEVETIGGCYVVEQLLGSGGMGTCIASATRAQRTSACAQATAADAQIGAEHPYICCSSASSIRSRAAHPRIIEVYDYGVDERRVLHDGAARWRGPARARPRAGATPARSARCRVLARDAALAQARASRVTRATSAARATAAPSCSTSARWLPWACANRSWARPSASHPRR